jgi:hypothetical protein
MAGELDGRSPFLWIDRQPERQRAVLLARLARGEIVSERLETRDVGQAIFVNDGLIHHWIGTIRLAGASLDRVEGLVTDYDHYSELFGPLVQRTRVLSHTPDTYEVFMRTSRCHLPIMPVS